MQQKRDRSCTEGHLPCSAPLANPYVPFQFNNPQVYEAEKGFARGTMYPGLDLPFMGMVNKENKPMTALTELQIMAFAIQELALYLDTHRDDVEALDLYRNYQKSYQDHMDMYEKKYGPLTHKSISGTTYKWLDDPWPWEYAKNREV